MFKFQKNVCGVSVNLADMLLGGLLMLYIILSIIH